MSDRNRLSESDDMFDDDDEDAQKDKFLTFRLGDEDYGIAIVNVLEIVGVQKITHVPDLPTFIKGVINLRGNVLPVLDVRLRFRLPERPYDERTCVIIVQANDRKVGMIVDQVQEVLRIAEDQVSPPPNMGRGSMNPFLQGLGKSGDRVVVLLNTEKILTEEEAALLSV